MIRLMEPEERYCIAKKLLESEIFQKDKILKVWLQIIGQTTFSDDEVPVNAGSRFDFVEMPAGHCLVNVADLARQCGCDRKVVRAALSFLEQRGSIQRRKSAGHTIAKLPKFLEYQETVLGTPKSHPTDPANYEVSERLSVRVGTPKSHPTNRGRASVEALGVEAAEWVDSVTGEFEIERVMLPAEIASLRVGRVFLGLAEIMEKKNRPLNAEMAAGWIRRLVELGEERGYYALRDAIERESKKKAAPKKYSYGEAFEKWWEAYPPLRRTEKPKAAEEFKRSVARLVDSARVTIDGQQGVIQIESREGAEAFLQRRVEAYAKSPQGRSKFSPAPHRWLRNAKFLESRAAWASGDDESPASDHLELRAAPPPI